LLLAIGKPPSSAPPSNSGDRSDFPRLDHFDEDFVIGLDLISADFLHLAALADLFGAVPTGADLIREAAFLWPFW
jgi:hypothetical protein